MKRHLAFLVMSILGMFLFISVSSACVVWSYQPKLPQKEVK
jgi:cyclic lactone autoinducer peptide